MEAVGQDVAIGALRVRRVLVVVGGDPDRVRDDDLVRPAMYESYHEIVPLHRDTTRRALVADIVGPICESGDCFAKDRTLQTLGEGELVAFMSAGAYGYTMASRYNTRGMPAEVLVKGSTFELINARENFEQMVTGEKIPAFLK